MKSRLVSDAHAHASEVPVDLGANAMYMAENEILCDIQQGRAEIRAGEGLEHEAVFEEVLARYDGWAWGTTVVPFSLPQILSDTLRKAGREECRKGRQTPRSWRISTPVFLTSCIPERAGEALCMA